MAIKAWNFLATRAGDIDWAGLPFVCGALGIDDPERLMHQLQTIKSHRGPNED